MTFTDRGAGPEAEEEAVRVVHFGLGRQEDDRIPRGGVAVEPGSARADRRIEKHPADQVELEVEDGDHIRFASFLPVP